MGQAGQRGPDMPTKRTRRSHVRRTLHVDSFGVRELIEFLGGWHVPQGEFERSRSHWQTWQAYMSDWIAIRDEALTVEPFTGDVPFAERVLRLYGAGGPPPEMSYEAICEALE